MCDVKNCPEKAIKKIEVVALTSIGKIKKEVNLCRRHLNQLQGGTKLSYSMGCKIKE
jgi:hypothetical protein